MITSIKWYLDFSIVAKYLKIRSTKMSEFKLLKSMNEGFPHPITGEKQRITNPNTGKDLNASEIKKQIVSGKEQVDDSFFANCSPECKKWHTEVILRVKRHNLDQPDSKITVEFIRPNGHGGIIRAKSGNNTISTFDEDERSAWWFNKDKKV